MGGNPAPLWDDLERYPEKYEPAVEPILRDLVSGVRPLSSLAAEEVFVLDRAVIDFVAPPPRKPILAQPKPVAEYKPAEPERKRPTEEPRPGVDVPADLEMPAYWWLR